MKASDPIEWLPPWIPVERQADEFVDELERELASGHVLSGKNADAIARRIDKDEVLFVIDDAPKQYAVVHLTWSGSKEHDPKWPFTVIFSSLEQWVDECMKRDHLEYNR